MSDNIREIDLLQKIASADSAAFSILYKRHFNMVRYFVKQNSGSNDDASDLFQEVLIIIFEKLRDQKLQLTCSLKTYIYSIARNQWMKQLRARKNTVSIKNFEDFVSVEIEEVEPPSISIVNLLNEIGDACRNLLILFYYRKKTMEEISVELNYSNADTAKNQKYKCIQRLKKMIAEKK
ncbi:MAG: sigma-70 family RNA polymerase sigma factor [Bacteroidia bacterium]|nr:sigma-70 family RNA polymerase sigma factor [Bacteroidia bacterium]